MEMKRITTLLHEKYGVQPSSSATISSRAFAEVLRELNVTVEDRPYCETIAKFSSTDLSYDEAMQAYNEVRIWNVFKKLDVDSSGSIDESEIALAMRDLGYKISSAQGKAMMIQLDSNNDGQISFQEFLAFFKAFPHASYEKMAENWLEASSVVDIGGDFSATTPTTGLRWWQTVIAGGTAGSIARTVTAPLEKIKIAAQTGRADGLGLIGELRKVYSTAGVKGLFAGNLTNLIRVFPTAGITCTVYLNLLALTPADGEFDAYEPLYRGGCAGAGALIANTLTYPLDIIRTRITVANANDRSSGILQTCSTIFRESGWRGLYRGLKPTLIAVVPFIAIQNATIDILRDKAISEGIDASPGLLIAAGATAGFTAQLVVYPLDVLRRRVQLSSSGEATGTTSSTSTSQQASQNVISDRTWIALQKTVKNHGFRSLFAGIVPTFLKTIPSVAIIALFTGRINAHFKASNINSNKNNQ